MRGLPLLLCIDQTFLQFLFLWFTGHFYNSQGSFSDLSSIMVVHHQVSVSELFRNDRETQTSMLWTSFLRQRGCFLVCKSLVVCKNSHTCVQEQLYFQVFPIILRILVHSRNTHCIHFVFLPAYDAWHYSQHPKEVGGRGGHFSSFIKDVRAWPFLCITSQLEDLLCMPL